MTLPSAVRADGRGRSLPLLAAMCLAAAAARARADASDRVQLEWHAPAGCSDAENVRARIRKLAGDGRDGAPLHAEGTVVRAGPGQLHLTLVVRADGAVETRELDASTCDDLAGAAAVHLALVLRSAPPPPSAAERAALSKTSRSERAQVASTPVASAQANPAARSESRGATVASTPVASAQANPAARSQSPRAPDASVPADPGARVESSRAVPSTHAWRGLVQLPLMAASIGPLPSPGVGAALAAGVELEGWRFLAQGSVWLRQTLRAESALDASTHVQRIAAGVRACRALSPGRLELAPCALLSMQHIWARGAGAHVSAHTAQATWLAAGVGADVRLTLIDRLALVAGLDAQWQTARPRLSIEGIGRVDQLGPLAITFFVGSEWIL